MKAVVLFAYVITAQLIFSCNQKQKAEGACFDYPSQIDSLGVQDLYDTARLYLFTWLCDELSDDYYRAQFELRYRSFFLQNDSLEIFFRHTLPDNLRDSNRSTTVYRTSMAFNIKTRKKLWGWDINGFSDAISPGDARFENPYSAEVVSFIKTHKDILNPCFLAFAKRSKIIEE